MKKGLILIFIGCFIALLLPINVLGASFAETSKVSGNISGMDYDVIKCTTSSNGRNYKQQLNVMQMKTDGANSKLVTWSIQDGQGFYKRAPLTDIAMDYEMNHPGYKVVGGINGDQYYFSYGGDRAASGQAFYYPQTYYPLIMDNEARFATSLYPSANQNFVGFANDSSSDSLIAGSKVIGYCIRILNDDGTVKKSIPLEGINISPVDGSTIYAPKYSAVEYKKIDKLSVEGENLFIVENSELSYMSDSEEYSYLSGESGVNAFFGRGYISATAKNYVLKENQFLISTVDETVISLLSSNPKVIVEQQFADERINNVESATGFHTCHMYDGVSLSSDADYNTKHYSRAIFGKKTDGTYVLLTADLFSGLYSGLNFEESNAILRNLGVVEAYQMDGGGSVTAILRNAEGTFDVSNQPTYGDERENLTGVLFVVKDHDVTINSSSITRNSVLLEKKNILFPGKIENVIVEIDNQKLSFDEDKLLIKDLNENTEYNIKISFDIFNNATKEKFTRTEFISFKTKEFIIPKIEFNILNIDTTSFTAVKAKSDESDNFKDVIIHVGDEKYLMNDEYELNIEGLFKDTTYSVYFEYTYYEKSTGNKYVGQTELFTIKTNAHDKPVITQFEEIRKTDTLLTIRYRIKDSDEVITNVYIQVNKEKYQLEDLSGTWSIDIDQTKTAYTVNILIEFSIEGETSSISSKSLNYDLISVEKKGCKKATINNIMFLTYSVVLICFFKRKNV